MKIQRLASLCLILSIILISTPSTFADTSNAKSYDADCIKFDAKSHSKETLTGFASKEAISSLESHGSIHDASNECQFDTKPSESFVIVFESTSDDPHKNVTCISDDQLFITNLQDGSVCLNVNQQGRLATIADYIWRKLKANAKIILTVIAVIMGYLALRMKKVMKIAEPTMAKRSEKWIFMNWGRTQSWEPKDVFAPNNFEELLNFMKNRKQNGVKNIRAFGALHSWSRCVQTTGTNVDTRRLNKILDVDHKNLRIKAEAGITLVSLYKAMRANKMAIPTMPNVDVITLGGAVSNGTHGTCITNGSFSSLVYGMELIDANGKMWNLTRDSKDPTISRYFDAALISFGSLGIIYSITMQCVEDYNMIITFNKAKFSDYKGRFVEINKKYDSAMYSLSEKIDTVLLKVNTKIGIEGSSGVAFKHVQEGIPFIRKITGAIFFFALHLGKMITFTQHMVIQAWGGMVCIHWDQYEIWPHTKPFVNMEYAIPENKIEQAIDWVNKVFGENPKYFRTLFWIIRPVGADDRGYLSATRRDDGTPTYYVDIPYQNKAVDEERQIYEKIEKGLLEMGGRCSFSRLFWNRTPSVLDNFWDKGGVQWKKAKLELDPEHVFTNELVNSIFFDNKIKLD